MTRHIKSPKQRAEENLARAERIVKRAAQKRTEASKAAEDAQKAYNQACVRRDYLKADPALQQEQLGTKADITVRTGDQA